MAYKGKFKPSRPQKYKGDPTRIIYRSWWERNVFSWLDKHKDVIWWQSEEVIVPYRSPIDGRMHRYFPDFYMKVKQVDGSIKRFIVEVKPKYQCKPPDTNPKRKTRQWLSSVKTWTVNEAKWKSANEFCFLLSIEFCGSLLALSQPCGR